MEVESSTGNGGMVKMIKMIKIANMNKNIKLKEIVLQSSVDLLIENNLAEYKPSNDDEKYMLLWKGRIYKKCDRGYKSLR